MRKLSICVGNSRQAAKWPQQEIDFKELYEKLKDPIKTAETVEQYKKMKKAERDEAKDKGGFMAGTLLGTRRKKKEVTSRSMITLDGDKLTTDFMEDMDFLISYECILYTTHSHTPEEPRARILIPLTRDVTVEEYNAIARYIAKDIGMDMIDPCSFEVNQLMYWPTVPTDGEYICRYFDGEWLDPDSFLLQHPEWKDCSKLPGEDSDKAYADSQKKQEDPLEKEGIVGAYCRTHSIAWVMENILSDVYEATTDDTRYHYKPSDSIAGVVVYEDKYVYSHHASDPAYGKTLNAFDLVRIHLFGDDDAKKSFQDMADYASKDDEVKMQIIREKQEKASAEFSESDDDWMKQLEYEKRSCVLKNNLHNLNLILENDSQLAGIVFNQQLDGMEIKGDVPWSHPSKYWRDADDAQLICYVDANYGTFSDRNYKIAVAKVSDDRRYHPILEFLASLPEWDGEERLDTLLVDYLGAEDNQYVRAVTRKTFCAAIKRVKDPGCKFDTMLVLNGAQGLGKSTLIAKMGGEWFSDSLSLNDTKDKSAAEKLQGYWLLEIGELAGLRKAEVETLRSFLSRQNDIYRAAFGRRPTPHPRQCIFIGTTNAENGYLRDTTGNRRFWPVKVNGHGTKKTWDLTKEEICQIWAEALHYVNQGEKLYLTQEEEALAKVEQRDAMESDEREGLIRKYLETLLPDNWEDLDTFDRKKFLEGDEYGEIGRVGTVQRTSVTNMEIWCECLGKNRADIKRSDSNELAAILTKLEWIRQDKKVRSKLYGPQFVFVPKDCS